MEINFTNTAKADIIYWKKQGNKAIQDKIILLLEAIQQDPFNGIGKPESLKHDLKGYWSRRINREHRIVYTVEKRKIIVIGLRYHY